jgi:beta-galactosidase
MHAGLLRPDSVAAEAFGEAETVMAELADAPEVSHAQAPVALMFDYDADAAWAVQPHGAGLSYFALVFDWYRSLRKLGLSVDILPATCRDFEDYQLVLAPGMMHMPDTLKSALAAASAQVILGPRTAARDSYFNTPVPLPPALPGSDLTVSRVQSMRPDLPVALAGEGGVHSYLEQIEGGGAVLLSTADGAPVAVRCSSNMTYMAGWGDDAAHMRLIRALAPDLPVLHMPKGVRCRHTGTETFWFNYGTKGVDVAGMHLPPAGVLRHARE